MASHKNHGLFILAGAVAVYFMAVRNKWQPMSEAKQYLVLVDSVESEHRIPNGLLARLIEQESHWNPVAYNARSDARGIAQIVPRWHPTLTDPYNPQLAIPYAGKYLKTLFDAFGHWDLALAAYNWGRGNLSRHLAKYGRYGFVYMPEETRNYVREILNDVSV